MYDTLLEYSWTFFFFLPASGGQKWKLHTEETKMGCASPNYYNNGYNENSLFQGMP